MTQITHEQARRYLLAAADDLLGDDERALLMAHLRECDSCGAEADALNALGTRLKQNFQARWDTQDGPSKNVLAYIQSQTRRIIMTNRINLGLKISAGIVGLFVLGLALNFVIGQLRDLSRPGSGPTATLTPHTPLGGLIAFVSEEDGNLEIYTMRPDGSEIINLTHNAAQDYLPTWSPDGKRIAFVSQRNGNPDIFIMNADGSGLIQLTDSPGNEEGDFSWSPDGQKIVYVTSDAGDPSLGGLMVVNTDGSGNLPLVQQMGSYVFPGWSADGKQIVYQKQDLTGTNAADRGTYVVDADGTNRRHLSELGMDPLRSQVAGLFYTVQQGYDSEDRATWRLYRFGADGAAPVELGFARTPIATWFNGTNVTYVVKSGTSWSWYQQGDTTSLSPLAKWDFAANCEGYDKDLYLNDANHRLSPDGRHEFVNVNCRENRSWFYLVNADGSQIRQLLKDPAINPPKVDFWIESWSPDGRYVILSTKSSQTKADSDFYLLDIEQALRDPSTKLVRLTDDGTSKYDAVWQPLP